MSIPGRALRRWGKGQGREKGRLVSTNATPKLQVVDRATYQAEIDALRVREKANMREADAIAAARRRMPVVEVDATTPVVGPNGPVPLLEVFEGRQQLVAYYHMWHGHTAAEQCEGCTFFTSQVRELSYLHAYDTTYAVFVQGPYEESAKFRDFMGYEMPWYSVQDSREALIDDRASFVLACYVRQGDRVFETYWTTGRGVEAMSNTYGLLDRTLYGRQEEWEDSPDGWPKVDGWPWRTNGRPTAQWPRIAAGHSDDLSGSRR
jgi:predicted dithiol-disulfide oxidoreductase (DUF899 family)